MSPGERSRNSCVQWTHELVKIQFLLKYKKIVKIDSCSTHSTEIQESEHNKRFFIRPFGKVTYILNYTPDSKM